LDAPLVERLYRSHGHLVLRRARRLLGDDHDAREVLHDVFTSLLAASASLRSDAAPTTWLYAATTHACLNRLRNRRTRARLLSGEVSAHRGRAAPSAEAGTIVRELLERVPEDLAQVAIYHFADEMTHEEIALVLGCSRRHVGDLIQRLLDHLRRLDEAS
jgi:RNA polymerase sigma-70 factor (ECF subfamily)